MKIKLNEDTIIGLYSYGMPKTVSLSKPFTLSPTTFMSTIEGLKPKQFTKQKQMSAFEDFLENPFELKNYCIVSAPNDSNAKLLAAFMMQHAANMASKFTSRPIWHTVTGGFDNPIVSNKKPCSLMVLTNVGTDSTVTKKEKLRDILETQECSKIVVATGCDPFEFFTRHLFLPVHGVFYLTNDSVKKISL